MRPGLVRLADEDDVGEAIQDFLLDRGKRTANDRHDAARPDLFQNLAHSSALNAHAGQTDKVGAGEPIEIDLLDILVDQRHAVMVGDERSEQGQAGNRQVGALAQQAHAMLQAPERGVEARIDDNDIGHVTPPTERA